MSLDILKHAHEKKVNESKLQSWIDAHLNVLLIGSHGIGKTERILSVFKKNFGSKWAFFNGATTDPWTDLVGIPHIEDVDGDKVIKYVRPEELPSDLEGIYIDELNRAKTATRNALLELIQFKSINGRVFENLKVVWSSVNPSDDSEEEDDYSYDVEQLDPAQIDRFHIIVRLSPDPDPIFFTNKYDLQGQNILQWWKEQPKMAKKLLTPRRLEYVIKAYNAGLDISDLLPKNCNVKQLKKTIDLDPIIREFDRLRETGGKPLEDFLAEPNNLNSVMPVIEKKELWNLLDYLKEEYISLLYSQYEDKIKNYFYDNPSRDGKLFKFLQPKIKEEDKFKELLGRTNADCVSDSPLVYKKKKLTGNKETLHTAVNEYLSGQDTMQTYYRRNKLDEVINNIYIINDKETLQLLLDFTNAYSRKIQKKSIEQGASRNTANTTDTATKEGFKFVELCKIVKKLCDCWLIDVTNQEFYKKLESGGVSCDS